MGVDLGPTMIPFSIKIKPRFKFKYHIFVKIEVLGIKDQNWACHATSKGSQHIPIVLLNQYSSILNLDQLSSERDPISWGVIFFTLHIRNIYISKKWSLSMLDRNIFLNYFSFGFYFFLFCEPTWFFLITFYFL